MPDFAELLKFVEECLPKDKSGNAIIEKEKSDVVHDLLAFLAEQMIEMNKQKQVEIKGFLGWLEREIRVKVEDLKNKTIIKEYHEHSFDDVISVLKKKENKNKITVIDTSGREFGERFEKEFNKSLDTLKPLKTKIQATDELIDQIVYKLYGLTPEEIKIVDESTCLREKSKSENETEDEET